MLPRGTPLGLQNGYKFAQLLSPKIQFTRTRCIVVARESGSKPGGGRGAGRYQDIGRGRGPQSGGGPQGSNPDLIRGLTLLTQPKTLDSSIRAADPGAGKAGKKINVLTNLFKLSMPAPVMVYQYSVDIAAAQPVAQEQSGQQVKKPTARKIGREEATAAVQALAAKSDWGSMYVYDNAAMLFSIKNDLEGEAEVHADVHGVQRQLKVKLSQVGSFDPKASIGSYLNGTGSPSTLTDLAPVMTLLEMVSKAAPAADPDSVRTPFGFLSYRTPAGGSLPFGGQLLKLLAGFRSSARVVKSGVALSVDYKVGAVLEDGPLMDVLLKVTGGRNASDLTKLKQKTQAARVDISGYQVTLSHIASRPILQGFSPLSARDLKFKLKDEGDREVSVEQYYKERYNVKLKFPDLPCVLARNGAAFPIELCTVVKAQRRASVQGAKNQAELIRALGKQAVVRPPDRLKRIMAAVQGPLGFLKGPVAQAFGLVMNAESMVVPARLIPGPVLEYKGLKTVNTGNDGEWRPPRDAPVRAAGKWSSAAVVAMVDKGNREQLKDFLSNLAPQLSKMGCPLPAGYPTLWGLSQDLEELLTEAVASATNACRRQPELLLVVLPEVAGEDVRNEVKRLGHSVLGVATQCLDPAKAGITRQVETRKMEQYCGNVALKINTKLGGTTAEVAGVSSEWAPYLDNKHFMVIGADVSRSTAAKGTTAFTYAGVVGTMDRQAVRLSEPQMVAQVGKNDDLIYGMAEAAEGLLRGYMQANSGSLPEVIVVYRDGVSESFYDQVLATEFSAIKAACNAIRKGYNPKLTYVVVSRSHNTRFFPKDAEHTHRSGNVMPGTVVDERVTDKFAFEFFLNSHAGIIGTNRVPRYTVLVDEFGFTSDSMQIFTHWLCHTYSLCHRSISVPPVVKYADKVAEEARQVGIEAVQRLSAAAASNQQQQQPQDYEVLAPLAMSGSQSMSFV